MLDLFLNAVKRRLGDERGIALPLALGVTVILSSLCAGIFSYSTTNQGAAHRAAADQRAYGLAEAGLSYAVSTLYNASDPSAATSVPSTTVTLPGGTVTYSGSLSGNIWTLTGRGTVANPTVNASPVIRTVSSQYEVGWFPDPVWQYNFSDATSGCLMIENDVDFSSPLYVRGDLCLQNEAVITGSPLHVGGTLSLQGETSVGTSSVPIASANLVEGCEGGSPDPHPCTSFDRVYASSITQEPGTLTKPPIDLAYWYENASPGPMHPCTVGSFPGGFDNDTTLNRSLNLTNLTPDSAYDCRTDSGRISWTPGNPGTLTVSGTIFFDGDIKISREAFAVYSGQATIYVSGTILFEEDARLCGVSACDASWDPSVNNIVLVAGHDSTSDGFKMEDASIFQGGAYVVKDYKAEDNVVMWGPVIANQLKLEDNVGQTTPFSTLPPGAPGATLGLRPVAGSYSG